MGLDQVKEVGPAFIVKKFKVEVQAGRLMLLSTAKPRGINGLL